jgi:hypothetical protein
MSHFSLRINYLIAQKFGVDRPRKALSIQGVSSITN